jgi:predicted RNase H-like nuclease
LVEAAASYEAFMRPASAADPVSRHRGSIPDAGTLLEYAHKKTGSPVDLVAVDMPLSLTPIVSRRASDNQISTAYGARHASTHTPSVTRPGKLSDDLRLGFHGAGYPLAVTEPKSRALVEVYPHPALIELAAAERRLPYKISKIRKYWPDAGSGARRENLVGIWRQIVELLDARVQGVATALQMPPVTARGYELKAFEDMLDAVSFARGSALASWMERRGRMGTTRPLYGCKRSDRLEEVGPR